MDFAAHYSLCMCPPADPQADMYDELAKQPANIGLLPALARRRPIWAASAVAFGRCCRFVFVRCGAGVYAWRLHGSSWAPVRDTVLVVGGADDVAEAAHFRACKRNAQKSWAYDHYPRYDQMRAIHEGVESALEIPETPYSQRDERGLFWDEHPTDHSCGGCCAVS
jgi:hypothetical protein